MIAQLELALVQELQQELALVRVQQQVLELAPVLVLVLQLVRELVQHLLHQQLQSRFQPQRSRLLQLEFLSILQQLAKVLQYQLCL